jgi:hypothetical protein
MNGLLLVAASVTLGLVVLVAASGAGSHARTIGLHVPGIHRDQRTWVRAHRLARWMVVPCCAVASMLGFAAIVSSGLAGLGWAIWLVGLIGGGLTATIASTKRSADRDAR